ncbi:MAG: nucleotide exchange factor GrpE [Blastochloris sp.]|nr:nucleotide exchange factor GrpE [Blastochloris sp.]
MKTNDATPHPTDETIEPAAETGPNINTEPNPGTPEAPAPQPDPAQLIQQLQEKLLRLQADFDNYRKRISKEKEDAIRYANEALLEQLLPVIDNFELGLLAAETATDAKAITQGMSMVKSQISRFLEDCGVREINATGQLFDPNLHEAVSQEVHADLPEGSILSQRRKGYKLRDRLLRPAIVVVAQAPTDSTETAAS